MLDSSYESSARQTSHIKHCLSFSEKNTKKKSKMLSAAVVLSALKVIHQRQSITSIIVVK